MGWLTQQAVDRARRGEGPTLIEAQTYRFMGHSRGDPGKYRTQDELSDWRSRDPISNYRSYLESHGVSGSLLDSMDEAIIDEIDRAIEFAQAASEPDPAETYSHVYSQHRN
jgi:TPP-dependent pyruvate/acetoin dehydrogenase alpha subunit